MSMIPFVQLLIRSGGRQCRRYEILQLVTIQFIF